VLRLAGPLLYRHLGETYTVAGPHSLDFRANVALLSNPNPSPNPNPNPNPNPSPSPKPNPNHDSDPNPNPNQVALLSRNVVVQGTSPFSQLDKYGAHIKMHSRGDESLTARIENIEVRYVANPNPSPNPNPTPNPNRNPIPNPNPNHNPNQNPNPNPNQVRYAGQGFRLGRYPIHFHMIGTVRNSYVRGNSIHHTYNRAVVIHGVHFLRVVNNVAFETMGNTFFVEPSSS